MSKIDSLTKEQELLLQDQLNLGLEIGRSIKPIDHAKIKSVITKLYAEIGYDEPKFLFFDSIFACNLAINKLTDKPPQHFNSNYFGGQQWCSWEIFYDFCRKIGVEYTDEQNKLLDLCVEQSIECHWWYPFDDTVVVSERPTKLDVDEQGRLHCANGPAIEYADGWKLYFWHGVNIPEDWIENKENLDVSIPLTWDNVDQRTAAAEIIGWDKVLDKLNSKVIDKDPDPEIGELIEVDLPGSPKERFLRAKCGTGKTICLCVGREYNTALDANAATYGIPVDILKIKEIRT